ncbi:hypothetical protein DPEC_G00194480 [Dallia pectoralis]|uniref:Uncharacterized protein n=1 Tax=Dallia pectoralis TaxID=75939 RepID=A0ACC2G777_DALPE|nr:hypothetical protein DPEC_G00194480 [Dallia pectoralis]
MAPPPSCLFLALSALLLHGSSGRMIGTASAAPSSGNSDLITHPLHGRDESMDNGGVRGRVLTEDDTKSQAVPKRRHIPFMFFPASNPLPPVSQDPDSATEPDAMAMTKLSLTATSGIQLSLVKDDNSDPDLEPENPGLENSGQMKPTGNLTRTFESSQRPRHDIARQDSLEKQGLERKEAQDMVVIDSLDPASSNTKGKQSHSSTQSSANPGQAPCVTNHFKTAKVLPAHAVRFDAFGPVTRRNLNRGPCARAPGTCGVPPVTYGTLLLWKDLSRTLSFAWELHVYGSAGLFLLLSCAAALGMVGGSTQVHPLCGTLTLANGLLLLTGTLRTALLLIDPYGTRRVLSLPVLTALYNFPLPLMLWAQVALTMISRRRADLNFLSSLLQRPRVVGGLAVVHCTLSLAADLLSPVLYSDLPVGLQSFSVCAGLSLCLGLLTQSLSHLHPFSKTPIAQWGTPQRSVERARRVTAVCALLGLVCLGMQVNSLLWLYGLLGDWRRFSWGWWLGQFWARVLELFWGFSMLVLASWVFWTPRRSRVRFERSQRMVKGLSFWERVQETLWAGPFRKSEKNWAELMPNNWEGQHSLKADSGSILGVYDDPPTADSLRDTMSLPHHLGGGGVPAVSGGETHLLWQQLGERECILSFIEFDMRPPSPINLGLSIDNALREDHRHLLGAGSLITTPVLSSGAQPAEPDPDISQGDSETTPASQTFAGHGCGLDVDSRPATTDPSIVREHLETDWHPDTATLMVSDNQPCSKPEYQEEKVPDNAVHVCGSREDEGGVTEDEDWACVDGNTVQLRSAYLGTTNNGFLAYVADNQTRPHASQNFHQLDAKLQRLKPTVRCNNDSMTLRVIRGKAPHFLVDGGDGSPVLPLSRMPTRCGFSVKRSRRDVMFVAPYRGCHVTQQGGNYVLPLRLWGATMTMSCPVASPTPITPSVSCFSSGMVVKLPVAADALKVKVSDVWEHLLSACQHCGFTFESFSGGVVITAPYHGPCVVLEANEHLLSLLYIDGEITLSCPTSNASTKRTTPVHESNAVSPWDPQAINFPQGIQPRGYPRGQEGLSESRPQEVTNGLTFGIQNVKLNKYSKCTVS